MAEKRKYEIACPKCKHEFEVSLYESVNIKTDPSLKDALMLNQLNAVLCPSCGLNFRVDKPLLYHDPDHQIMIYWIPASEAAYEEGEDQFRAFVDNMTGLLPDGVQPPDIQLVFTRTELVERIFTLDAGLNPRLVEYVKYGIYAKNNRQLDVRKKQLLFNAQDSTEEMLCFIVQDLASKKFESMVHYPRATFKAMEETFSSPDRKSGDLLKIFPGPHISARAHFLSEQEAGLDTEE